MQQAKKRATEARLSNQGVASARSAVRRSNSAGWPRERFVAAAMVVLAVVLEAVDRGRKRADIDLAVGHHRLGAVALAVSCDLYSVDRGPGAVTLMLLRTE